MLMQNFGGTQGVLWLMCKWLMDANHLLEVTQPVMPARKTSFIITNLIQVSIYLPSYLCKDNDLKKAPDSLLRKYRKV